MTNCKSCGAAVPFDGGPCSSDGRLICQGRAPVPPCGAVLTAEERHWYGSTCETCEREWGERIERWRAGGADVELSRMFDLPTGTVH